MDLFLYFWVLRQPALQADEKLSHKEGEALLQRWAQESNVDYDSFLERQRCEKWGEKYGELLPLRFSQRHDSFVFLFKLWISWRNGETVWTVLDIVVSSSDAINVVWYNFHLYSAQVKQQESPFNESTSNRTSEPWLVKWCCPFMYKYVYSITRKLGVRRCEDGQLVGDPRHGSTCRVCQDRPQVSCAEFCQRWVNGWHPEGIYNYIYIYTQRIHVWNIYLHWPLK